MRFSGWSCGEGHVSPLAKLLEAQEEQMSLLPTPSLLSFLPLPSSFFPSLPSLPSFFPFLLSYAPSFPFSLLPFPIPSPTPPLLFSFFHRLFSAAPALESDRPGFSHAPVGMIWAPLAK